MVTSNGSTIKSNTLLGMFIHAYFFYFKKGVKMCSFVLYYI
ncbi:hypothetical protein ESA2_CDS61 [Staphylococcus phage ESa2]|nr:hypothetical protein ESA2_CDS61 [Staphylococcus phage ESa2]